MSSVVSRNNPPLSGHSSVAAGSEVTSAVCLQAFVTVLLYRLREDDETESALWKIGLPTPEAATVVATGSPGVHCLEVRGGGKGMR